HCAKHSTTVDPITAPTMVMVRALGQGARTMEVRKTVIFQEEIAIENGSRLSTPMRRVVVASVIKNPLAHKPVGEDLKPLVDISVELGTKMTKTAISLVGDAKNLRAYS